MNEKILIIEDEIALSETLCFNLTKESYRTFKAVDGPSGVKLTREIAPNLVILDIMLPIMDGFEVCRQIRKETNIPVLMLTARGDEIDKVVGLEVGADDYLTKPFSMRELIARVKALLRRSAFDPDAQMSSKAISFSGNLTINQDRHEVSIEGTILDLQPKEYDLLLFLVKNKKRIVTRDEILTKVWGWEYLGNSRTVDVHMRWLRQKLEDDPNKPKRIVTVHGEGYIFEG